VDRDPEKEETVSEINGKRDPSGETGRPRHVDRNSEREGMYSPRGKAERRVG
jgi:hypothetical protein